jgi:NADPH:quinone reductase-like Zn-dependent oxidoreductase
VPFFGGEDGVCEPCRRGDIVNCQNPVIPGVTVDGGYAEVLIAESRGVASIPDELTSAEAAPLLCAGITTYNALRNAGLRGGDLVAVQGIGGLGHLGIQFARRMGFRTVALGRGREKEKLATDLRAHVYVDTAVDDAVAVLQRLGGARAILATGTSGEAMGQLVSGLAARGKFIVVGVPGDHIPLSALPLVFGGRSIYGALTGTAIDNEDTLAFSVLQNIRPMIETASHTMTTNIENKVILITGASSGIGEATARLLARKGGKVLLGARRTNRLEKIVAEIREDGGTAHHRELDVTSLDDVKAFAALAEEKLGTIDVLINNAGIMPLSPLHELKLGEWNQMIDVNIRGVLHGIAAVLPKMRERKSGHIRVVPQYDRTKFHSPAHTPMALSS